MAVSSFTRRSVLGATGLAAAAVAGSSLLAGCSTPGQETGDNIPTSEIPVGGGLVLTKGKYVITQPTPGQFHAFTNVCAHAGCQVARVKDNQIQCDCHGSRYSITDGHPEHGPTVRALAEYPVSVNNGKLRVLTPALTTPTAPWSPSASASASGSPSAAASSSASASSSGSTGSTGY
ncbi:Rieske (2Fe-2S) protein [Raineyella fluvialis]|uniref:Cytochrome bc1 complex Rieske iron-sulfur subunit n=1 Tax=Raineyella fluvialis TaxID=2662261 RepID=A0A5Q2FGI2_9ACTN|nr:Rieske (2Fe-2S) protein [Raineyella fluvialis]QGF24644.1 Rieske 2Fe-2S domain-containing protein [Raineyella fluvialis]